jgi:penicillin amidase
VPLAHAGWSSLDVAGETVDIYRDDYGRPHIFAATNRGLFTAYGYALAEDRLWRLELNRRVARGRLAEILGPGTPVLSDTFIRTTGYTDAELDAQFAALPEPRAAGIARGRTPCAGETAGAPSRPHPLPRPSLA